MSRTLHEWQKFLTKRMDEERPRINRLRSYAKGQGDLPEMGENLRKAWEQFQRRSRANPAKLIVTSMTDRLIPNGLTIGESADNDKTRVARRIWRDNRLSVVFADTIWDAAVLGKGYILVTQDEDGHAVITSEKPEHLYVEPDPIRPWRALAAIKVWREPTEDLDHMTMWVDGIRVSFVRSARDKRKQLISRVEGDWTPIEESIQLFDGPPPVVILENRFAVGEFEEHLDVINRINWQILQRLVIIAMQAFRQRALKTSSDTEMPDEDEDGNDIDYQTLFEPSPGALWELPPGVEIWESAQTSIGEILNAVKDDWRELASETQTPLTAMLPDSANQSASGAEQPQKGLVAKATDRIERFKPALASMMVKALAVEGVELDESETVEVLFVPPYAVTLTERYAAAVQARNAGEALETIQLNILGYSPEQVAQDKQRRTEEQLALAMNLMANQATAKEV